MSFILHEYLDSCILHGILPVQFSHILFRIGPTAGLFRLLFAPVFKKKCATFSVSFRELVRIIVESTAVFPKSSLVLDKALECFIKKSKPRCC